MKYGNLILEKREYVALKRLLNFHNHYKDHAHKDALKQLKNRLEHSSIQDETNVPDDLVRMSSKVTFISEHMKTRTIQLTMPYEENSREDGVSVISTLGANLIGHSKGDSLQIKVPTNIQNIKIVNVENPLKTMPKIFLFMDY